MKKAIISDCGRYRYLLSRSINNPTRSRNRGILFIMLNPSTADATNDDPTIRRCLKFSKEWGFNIMEVVNLYALRSSHPFVLKLHKDPIGPLNTQILDEKIRVYATRVCAWGSNKYSEEMAEFIKHKYSFALEFKCLGVNKDGSPKHPLYVPAHKGLEIFQW